MNYLSILLSILLLLNWISCTSEKANSQVSIQKAPSTQAMQIIPGAERLQLYYPKLKGKKVGVVANHTSMVGKEHLVDTLLAMGIDIKKIFAPEHGFRGEADAGARIADGKDCKTGLPVISLYGRNKKPRAEDIKDIDVFVFDIQDVGVRFYTYISTLHYILESAGEEGKSVVLLDRPNPNAYYVDGPVLEKELTSFVGMHPVPIVYGMTIGEYGTMILGENWIDSSKKPKLDVIPVKNYTHDSFYALPIKPSPNLPNTLSILLYPSLCLFEGTTVSIGRGTQKQFQVIGHPDLDAPYRFTPTPQPGASSPKLMGKKCAGWDLTKTHKGEIIERQKLDLSYVIKAYKNLNQKNQKFFLDNNFFDKLAGTKKLKEQIRQGLSENDIRATWKADIETFKNIRKKYLIYNEHKQ